MSHGSFHVHGPHDHQLEHAAQHGSDDRFSGRIAVMTAVIGLLFIRETKNVDIDAET